MGSFLPGFTPICADLKTSSLMRLINVRVVEAYTTGGEALSIKVAKNSLAYVGMFVGSGKKGAEVTAIDKSNAGYDVLTIKLLLVRISPKMPYYSMRLQLMV